MVKKLLLFFLLIACISTLIGCSNKTPNQNASSIYSSDSKINDSSNLMSKTNTKADKIEVVHFHGAQQCWSCVTVGEYALKTIKEKFPDEYKNGTIVFRDINGELPKNKDLVIKYQARGSSLFINAIKDGKDNIKEDVTVWRLISNEKQFINYFENNLNKLLDK